MKNVMYFAIYALALLNVYIWMIWPDLLLQALWKWDIFIILLWAPLIYKGIRDENLKR